MYSQTHCWYLCFKENPADTLRLKREKRTQIATNMHNIIIH